MNRLCYWMRGFLVATLATATFGAAASAQDFDFDKLNRQVRRFAVVIDMKVEISFGMHSTEQEGRYLGAVVDEQGLVIFNGASLSEDLGLSHFSGLSVQTNPTRIEIATLDGREYEGEYLGVDRYSRVGFLRIKGAPGETFEKVTFKEGKTLEVGSWVALYMLLPEFITPSLAADVGMISAIVESPERFPLTIGLNPMQLTSVLFDKNLDPVGIVGALIDPGLTSGDALESFGQVGFPLLGVITAERLAPIIADPPTRGEIERGWLGIMLQALTTDMAGYWDLDIPGGIIVNDIMKGSPAEMSGLHSGDIIIAINGEAIEVNRDENLPVFRRKIAELGPGVSVEFDVIRRDELGNDRIKIIAQLEAEPLAAPDAPDYENESFELTVRDLVFDDYLYLNLDSETFAGAFVSELRPGGLADVGGLRFGDVIQRIGPDAVESAADVQMAIERIETDQPREVIFFIWRDNQTMFVNVKTDWE